MPNWKWIVLSLLARLITACSLRYCSASVSVTYWIGEFIELLEGCWFHLLCTFWWMLEVVCDGWVISHFDKLCSVVVEHDSPSSVVIEVSISHCKSRLASYSCYCLLFPASFPHVLLRCWFLMVKNGEDYNPVRAGGCQFFHLEHVKRQHLDRLDPADLTPHHCSWSPHQAKFFIIFLLVFTRCKKSCGRSQFLNYVFPHSGWAGKLSPCPLLD